MARKRVEIITSATEDGVPTDARIYRDSEYDCFVVNFREGGEVVAAAEYECNNIDDARDTANAELENMRTLRSRREAYYAARDMDDPCRDVVAERIAKAKKEKSMSAEGTITAAEVRRVNKEMRARDESHLYPVCGRFNVTNRAINAVRAYRRAGYNVYDADHYEHMLENTISEMINSNS